MALGSEAPLTGTVHVSGKVGDGGKVLARYGKSGFCHVVVGQGIAFKQHAEGKFHFLGSVDRHRVCHLVVADSICFKDGQSGRIHFLAIGLEHERRAGGGCRAEVLHTGRQSDSRAGSRRCRRLHGHEGKILFGEVVHTDGVERHAPDVLVVVVGGSEAQLELHGAGCLEFVERHTCKRPPGGGIGLHVYALDHFQVGCSASHEHVEHAALALIPEVENRMGGLGDVGAHRHEAKHGIALDGQPIEETAVAVARFQRLGSIGVVGVEERGEVFIGDGAVLLRAAACGGRIDEPHAIVIAVLERLGERQCVGLAHGGDVGGGVKRIVSLVDACCHLIGEEVLAFKFGIADGDGRLVGGI